MKKFIASVLCAPAVALSLYGGAARADSKCNDVGIVVTNGYIGSDGYEKDIKVTDISYYDDEDNNWRNETTSNHTINFGSAYTWTKNLSFVGGEQGVKVKIYYQVYDNGSWGSTRTTTSGAFRCIDSTSVWITVD
jgi:hypothetical protein